MDSNFVQANSGNLPKIDALMVALFFKDNPDFYGAELKNVKTAISARESYGDDAIGYVQLCREADICTVKCKMCPEHKVHKKSYSLTMVVAGGCKHAVTFLMWTHRRSEEPACTSVECYWKKPLLSRVGTTLKFITAEQLSRNTAAREADNGDVLSEFLQEAKKRKIKNCELIKYQNNYKITNMKQYSWHHFIMNQSEECKQDVGKLLELMKAILSKDTVALISQATKQQSKSTLWYELRYGSITASKAYEASRCKTAEGSLVAAILGTKMPDTTAMKRGRNLELSVRKVAGKKLKKKFKSCGLFISQEYPMIAASPNGICNDAIIEIKCPTNIKEKQNYVVNGVIANKYLAQIQLQMYTTGIKKCYFCIADDDFEVTKNVEIIVIAYDLDYVTNLLNSLVSFWISKIYPILYRSTSLQ